MELNQVNMKRVIIALSATIMLMASTCRENEVECYGDSHNGLIVLNKSTRRINFEIYWNYPDTSIGEYNPKGFGVINPNENSTRGVGPTSCWESVLKDDKKEYIFIFDEDSLQLIPWDTVRATNRGLLERREISLKYLQINNFTITYP
jgi:hypothetical protein